MTDLTEQWKKRKIRNGAYYIKTLGGDILPAFCNTEYILKQFQTMKGIYSDVAEVLAEVPTFDEWQQLKKWCEEFNALNVAKENTKLKELLKDARNVLKMVDTYYGDYDSTKGFLIVERIDEVLNG